MKAYRVWIPFIVVCMAAFTLLTGCRTIRPKPTMSITAKRVVRTILFFMTITSFQSVEK